MTKGIPRRIAAMVSKAKRDAVTEASTASGATDLAYTASTRSLTSSTGTDVTLPLVTSANAGLAPASGGGTSNFLRADATWAAPASGATDLSYTASTRLLASSTGADVTLPLVGSDAGLMSAADKTKLDAISGTNTGDQTTIVGITGTKAQFDTAVTDGNFLYVGDVTSNATHTGDVTGATALTIANDAVTYAKMQNAPSAGFIGATAAGDYAHRTPTEVTAALDVFTTSLKGLAPSSGGGTTNFLRADGTWAAPPAGGSLALTDLTDVTITSGAQGNSLVRGASEFQNLNQYTFTVGPFFVNDVPGTATTQATLAYFNTATALSRDADDMKIQTAGRIVGIIMTSDVARTAGTATARVRIAGAGAAFNGGSVVLDATNTLSDSDFVAWGSGNAFTAGQLIGAEVVTSGWTPTTANIAIWLIVMMQF